MDRNDTGAMHPHPPTQSHIPLSHLPAPSSLTPTLSLRSLLPNSTASCGALHSSALLTVVLLRALITSSFTTPSTSERTRPSSQSYLASQAGKAPKWDWGRGVVWVKTVGQKEGLCSEQGALQQECTHEQSNCRSTPLVVCLYLYTLLPAAASAGASPPCHRPLPLHT